jgi:hypothetical protein
VTVLDVLAVVCPLLLYNACSCCWIGKPLAAGMEGYESSISISSSESSRPLAVGLKTKLNQNKKMSFLSVGFIKHYHEAETFSLHAVVFHSIQLYSIQFYFNLL